MILRILIIGAAITLIAAFFGHRKLAVGLMMGLSAVAAGLWIYEGVQSRSQSSLLQPEQVVLSQVRLEGADYRPNLFELTGQVENQDAELTLNGVSLRLRLRDCQEDAPCKPLVTRQEFVGLKLAPGERARFLEKIYLEKSQLPKGRLEFEYEIIELRGHRPLW